MFHLCVYDVQLNTDDYPPKCSICVQTMFDLIWMITPEMFHLCTNDVKLNTDDYPPKCFICAQTMFNLIRMITPRNVPFTVPIIWICNVVCEICMQCIQYVPKVHLDLDYFIPKMFHSTPQCFIPSRNIPFRVPTIYEYIMCT